MANSVGKRIETKIPPTSREGWGVIISNYSISHNRPDLDGWIEANMWFDDSPSELTAILTSQPSFHFNFLCTEQLILNA